MRALIAVASTVILVAGCGGGDEPRPAGRSDRLVDFSLKPPYINALDVDPGSDDFLLTTNRGCFRIDAKAGTVARVRGTVSKGGASSPVGTFLELLSTGPGRLLGSGHPDRKGVLPPYLGLIASDDGGRSWTSVSRLGEVPGEPSRFKALGAERPDLALSDGTIVSTDDGGKTWRTAFRP